MNICMICGSYPPDIDGVGDYSAIVSSKLVEAGALVSLITSKGHETTESNILTIPKWNFMGMTKIIRVLRKLKVDIVHIQYPSKRYGRSIAINLLSLFARISLPTAKVVITQHEFANYTFLGKIRNALNLLFCHTIIVPEVKNIDSMITWWPFLRHKTEYIPIASNVNPITHKTHFEHKTKDPVIIAYFGIVRPHKGIESLLSAVSKLKNKNVRVLIVGELRANHSYHKDIYKLIEHYGLTKRVDITGYCDEKAVSRYLVSSDLAVLPFPDGVSERRGSFLAALAHGLPVITTKGSYLPDGLEDAMNVKLVRPGDPDDLSKTIEIMIDNDDLRMKVAIGGYKWVEQFSWSRVVNQHLNLYARLVR